MAAQTTQTPSPRHYAAGTRLLRLPAVAAELGCSLDTIDRYIRSGKIPVVRLPSGRRRIAREDLDAVIASWREESR